MNPMLWICISNCGGHSQSFGEESFKGIVFLYPFCKVRDGLRGMGYKLRFSLLGIRIIPSTS